MNRQPIDTILRIITLLILIESSFGHLTSLTSHLVLFQTEPYRRRKRIFTHKIENKFIFILRTDCCDCGAAACMSRMGLGALTSVKTRNKRLTLRRAIILGLVVRTCHCCTFVTRVFELGPSAAGTIAREHIGFFRILFKKKIDFGLMKTRYLNSIDSHETRIRLTLGNLANKVPGDFTARRIPIVFVFTQEATILQTLCAFRSVNKRIRPVCVGEWPIVVPMEFNRVILKKKTTTTKRDLQQQSSEVELLEILHFSVQSTATASNPHT
jgi:hypothetical protein